MMMRGGSADAAPIPPVGNAVTVHLTCSTPRTTRDEKSIKCTVTAIPVTLPDPDRWSLSGVVVQGFLKSFDIFSFHGFYSEVRSAPQLCELLSSSANMGGAYAWDQLNDPKLQ